MVDVNNFFINPKERLTVAQRALHSTELGRQGVVRLSQDPIDGKISYIISATGEVVDSIEDAFIKSSGMLLTNFTSIFGDAMKIGSETYDSRFAQAGGFLNDIKNKLKNATSEQKTLLKNIGLDFVDQNEIDKLTLNILTSKTESSQTIGQTGAILKSKGMGYVPIIDAEGGSYLTMKTVMAGKEINLSSSQIHMLSNILGSGILNSEKLISSGLSGDLPGQLDKIPKRLRAFFSERDLVLGEEDILKSIGIKGPNKSLEKNILRVDSGIDYLKKYFDLSTREFDNAIDPLTKKGNSYIRTVGKEKYNLIDELLNEKNVKAVITNLSNDTELDILKSVKDLIENSQSSKEFLKNVEGRFGENSDQYKAVDKIVNGIKREFDGTTAINQRIKDGAIKKINNLINSRQFISGTNLHLQNTKRINTKRR